MENSDRALTSESVAIFAIPMACSVCLILNIFVAERHFGGLTMHSCPVPSGRPVQPYIALPMRLVQEG